MDPIENPKLILVVGGIGLGVNVVGLLLFGDVGHGHSHGGDGHGHSHADHGHGQDNHGFDVSSQADHDGAENKKPKKSVNNSQFKVMFRLIFLAAGCQWASDEHYRGVPACVGRRFGQCGGHDQCSRHLAH